MKGTWERLTCFALLPVLGWLVLVCALRGVTCAGRKITNATCLNISVFVFSLLAKITFLFTSVVS